jgi:exoribonuclease-2
MHVFYEDDGNFRAGHILSEADASLQVESETGKRSKIKRVNALFTFAQPTPSVLLAQATDLVTTIDLEFLWECAPQNEFDAADLAKDYFGHTPTAVEHAAILLRLHGAPAYFHRRGRGHYRPAPPDVLQAAQAAIEKKAQQARQQQAWVDEMLAGGLPAVVAALADSVLTKPDKNTQAWKALEAAAAARRLPVERMLLELGAWPHPLALHQRRFLANYFPRGRAFPPITVPPLTAQFPVAEAEIYSVDDSTTTEIDDALSVKVLADNQVQVGIHIAAPGLAVTPSSPLDDLARQRLSTVYMPGDKIPMQPDAVIEAFSLDAGREVAALSLYVTADLATGEIQSSESRIERITVRENLRHNHLEASVTEALLDDPTAEMPYGHWLRPLWRLAGKLSARRDQARGKPENNNRLEYSFYLDGSADDPDTPVRLVPRQRNAPLDRMVAEYMILANNLWGGLLAECGLPGIYRSQQAGRVRMSTQALPHEAIGVPQYAWSTSPLRRYVDLVNQWQLLAAVEHGVSARLVAPFKPRDADLFAIISAFDAQYGAWADFQNSMERYWCLRWLQQQKVTRTTAHVLRDDLVRLAHAPLVLRVGGLPALTRGAEVEIDLLSFDEVSLEAAARFVAEVKTAACDE